MGGPDISKQRRSDTVDPRRSRERAVKILFQADVRHTTPDVTLQQLIDDADARSMLDEVDDLGDGKELLPPIAYEPGVEVERVPDDPATTRLPASGRRRAPAEGAGDDGAELDGFTCTLVLGVHEHRERIDELISQFARRWQISRMPVVDRTVLRLATYELLHETTAPAVVIDEAVNLAKDLSTDDSGRYVNGVLESVRKHLADNPEVAVAISEPEVVADVATDPDEAADHVTDPEDGGPLAEDQGASPEDPPAGPP